MYHTWYNKYSKLPLISVYLIHTYDILYKLNKLSGGCGPVHKPFAYHAGARRSFPGGDNATPQTAKQTANKGCTIVHLKWRLQVDIPEAQKPRAKTIGSPHKLPHQW